MGVFNKINERAGFITGAIVIALLLFIVGGDLLDPRSFFSGSKNVGEIAGEDVTFAEYDDMYQRVRRGGNTQDESQAHNQAWGQMIMKYAYPKQYEKLGLAVSDEEMEEMITGSTEYLHPSLLQAKIFMNEATGQFDRKKFDEWVKNPRNLEQIESSKPGLIEERLFNKYINLFINGVYVTKEEAKRDYMAQNVKATVKYLWVPYSAIPDSTVKYTDDDLQEYLNKNSKLFKREDRRNVIFVSFSVKASSKDTLDATADLAELKKEFQETKDDSLFIQRESDVKTPAALTSVGQLPEFLKYKVDSMKIGDVYGPIQESGKYKLYKILDITEDPKDSMYYGSTKHILLSTRDLPENKKDSVKRKAEELLNQLKNGADFDEMVKKYSADPGSQNKTGEAVGEYKFFPKGQMVKPFENAVFNAKTTGLVPQLVPTDYGYHILKVTDTKTNKKVKFATIEKEVTISEGRDIAYQKANNFAAAVKDTASFMAQAKKDSLNAMSAKNLQANDPYVSGLTNPRELIRWAFNDASKGEISPVLTVGDQYVVAILVDARDKGTAELDEVRDELKMKVLNEMKSKIITEKLQKTSGTLEKKGEAFGTFASVGTANDVGLQSGSMQGIGYEPTIVGTVFGLVPGKRTNPVQGDNGVAVLELIKITEAKEIADYSANKKTMMDQKKGSVYSDIDQAIREDADIEDERVKFY